MDGRDIARVRGKQAIIVDDVISTGSTLHGVEKVLAQANCKVINSATILTEGDNPEWQHVIALGNLPVWSS